MDFQDKVAIVTGSAMGIGKGIAVALAKKGVHMKLNKEDEMYIYLTHLF